MQSGTSDSGMDWQHGVIHQLHIGIGHKPSRCPLVRTNVKRERVRHLQAWMKAKDKIRSTMFSCSDIAFGTFQLLGNEGCHSRLSIGVGSIH